MLDRLPLPLVCHPARPSAHALNISAEARRDDAGDIMLRYRVVAPSGLLRLPPPQPAGPADNLWQTTCCEAFIALPGVEDYLEFNLSPSGQWAVYRFASYRQRDMAFAPAAAPIIDFAPTAEGFTLLARLPATLLPAGELAVSLTAVIETADGDNRYWALTHAGEQPDFHLAQSFTLRIPPDTP